MQSVTIQVANHTPDNDKQSASKTLAWLHQLRELTLKARLDDALMQDINTAMPAHLQLELSIVSNALNDFEFEQALIAIDHLIEKFN